MTVTPEMIAELRRLCEAATPGPWESRFRDGDFALTGPATEWVVLFPSPQTSGFGIIAYDERRANQRFIAASRTALPALLDALEAERARVKEMEAGLKETLRMLEAAHRQLGMHSASNERVNRIRALLPEQTDG